MLIGIVPGTCGTGHRNSGHPWELHFRPIMSKTTGLSSPNVKFLWYFWGSTYVPEPQLYVQIYLLFFV